MRRTFLLLTILVVFTQMAVSQYEELDVDAYEITDSTVFKKVDNKQVSKLKFGLNAGMSYMFASNGVNGPSVSLSPNVSYPLGDRFSMFAGVMLEHGNFYVPHMNSEFSNDGMLPMTRMFAYAGGNYKLSEKLTVTGSAYKEILDVPNRNKDVSHKSTYNYHGISAGFDYKLTPNITIGARVRVESPSSMWNNQYYPGFNYYPLGL